MHTHTQTHTLIHMHTYTFLSVGGHVGYFLSLVIVSNAATHDPSGLLRTGIDRSYSSFP